MYLGGLSIAILLSSKTEFGYEAKATPPHLNPGRASTFFASQPKFPSLQVQSTHSFLAEDIPLLLLVMGTPGRPIFDTAELAPHRPPTRGAETQKKAMPAPWRQLTCMLSCSSTWKAGCRESAYSPDATRSYTAASTGKGAAGEQQLLIQEPLYCFWRQAGKSTGHHMLLLKLWGYALKK